MTDNRLGGTKLSSNERVLVGSFSSSLARTLLVFAAIVFIEVLILEWRDFTSGTVTTGPALIALARGLSWTEPFVTSGVLAAIAIALQVAVHGIRSTSTTVLNPRERGRARLLTAIAVLLGAASAVGTIATVVVGTLNDQLREGTGDLFAVAVIGIGIVVVCLDAARVVTSWDLVQRLERARSERRMHAGRLAILRPALRPLPQLLLTTVGVVSVLAVLPPLFLMFTGQAGWDLSQFATLFLVFGRGLLVFVCFGCVAGVLTSTSAFPSAAILGSSIAFGLLLSLSWIPTVLDAAPDQMVGDIFMWVIYPSTCWLAAPLVVWTKMTVQPHRPSPKPWFGLHGLIGLVSSWFLRWAVRRDAIAELNLSNMLAPEQRPGTVTGTGPEIFADKSIDPSQSSLSSGDHRNRSFLRRRPRDARPLS